MYWYIIAGVVLILLFCLCMRLILIRKVRRLPLCQKLALINEASRPFGFVYDCDEDIFTSDSDAWQKEFGYSALYDQAALLFHIVTDCEPIYFDYRGNTWLIEFWKGQYGINTGAEVGVYRANGLIPPEERGKTFFFGVSKDEAPKISFRLLHDCSSLFTVAQRSWWVTGFDMGKFTWPDHLRMPVLLTFPNDDMARAFVDGMLEAGYCRCDISVCSPCVSFCFRAPKMKPPYRARPRKARWVQKKNACMVRLFLLVTRPFTTTLDRLVFLRLHLPFAFRRIVCLKKWRSWHFPKKQRRCHGH